MERLGTLILIEPSEEAREVLSDRLRMQGYTVTVTGGPAEGAHLALQNPPRAVVADLWMPGISGVQLCRLLKAEPATANVPVVLRGPEGQRNRFWAEQAGAAEYVVKGRMGDLVRALSRVIAAAPPPDDFFTDLGSEGTDIRDRIASYLDNALFESVLASEVRKLSLCGAYERLFDLFAQFCCQVLSYRWLALSTETPRRVGLHVHPLARERASAEVRAAFGIGETDKLLVVEDEDAYDEPSGGTEPIVLPVRFADTTVGRLAFAGRSQGGEQDAQILNVIARELGGPIRMATLVEEANRLATVDPLTGLLNRRSFLAQLKALAERATRTSGPLSLMLLDVDHFKLINDQRGHASGDSVLAAIGRALGHESRRGDLIARWGGEEFVVALAGADEDESAQIAEALRVALAGLRVEDAAGAPIPLTASFGVATYEPGERMDVFLDRADKAMYAAKFAGRNCVRRAPPAQPQRQMLGSGEILSLEPVPVARLVR